MRQELLDNVVRRLESGTDSLRRRLIRRDLVMNGVVSVVVGLLALLVMPPSGVEWAVVTQVAVAAVVAAVVFGLGSALFVLSDVLGSSW